MFNIFKTIYHQFGGSNNNYLEKQMSISPPSPPPPPSYNSNIPEDACKFNKSIFVYGWTHPFKGEFMEHSNITTQDKLFELDKKYWNENKWIRQPKNEYEWFNNKNELKCSNKIPIDLDELYKKDKEFENYGWTRKKKNLFWEEKNK
jgi:hypothetical protein